MVIGSSLFGDSIHQYHLLAESTYKPKHAVNIVCPLFAESTNSWPGHLEPVCIIYCCVRALLLFLFFSSQAERTTNSQTHTSNIAINLFSIHQDLSRNSTKSDCDLFGHSLSY